jgi:hypothetical protein
VHGHALSGDNILDLAARLYHTPNTFVTGAKGIRMVSAELTCIRLNIPITDPASPNGDQYLFGIGFRYYHGSHFDTSFTKIPKTFCFHFYLPRQV